MLDQYHVITDDLGYNWLKRIKEIVEDANPDITMLFTWRDEDPFFGEFRLN